MSRRYGLKYIPKVLLRALNVKAVYTIYDAFSRYLVVYATRMSSYDRHKVVYGYRMSSYTTVTGV